MGDFGFVTRLIVNNAAAAPMLKLPDNLGFYIMFLDNAVQLTSSVSSTCPAPLIDFGNNFGFVACRGGEALENAFANSNFLFFFMWPSLAGNHNWNFPAMSGFLTQAGARHGGYFMNTNVNDGAIDVGDFAARGNQVRRIDSSDIAGAPDAAFTTAVGETTLTDSTANFNPSLVGRTVTVAGATTPANNGTWPIIAVTPTTVVYANAAGVAEAQGAATYVIGGPIEATFPSIWGVVGEVITLTDVGGAAGLNPISVVSPSWLVEAPYLTRPFQSKTWESQPGGTWLLVADSYEESITSVFAAAFTAVNNSTNLAETDTLGASFAATLPLAADAEAGAKITIRNTSTGGGGFTVDPTASGADTVDGTLALADGSFGTYQSDGVATWYQIS
jgi:hypothetical protein